MFAKYQLVKGLRRVGEISNKISADIENFKNLLTPSEYLTFRDRNGNNLLQIAILQNNLKTFNYLLSLADFPLNSLNKKCENALMTALSRCRSCVICPFSKKLIEHGADINREYPNGDTILLKVLRSCCDETCISVIANGADVNAGDSRDVTPLKYALKHRNDELVCCLLYFGATCDLSDFVYAVLKNRRRFVLENFLNFVFDDWTRPVKMSLRALLKLAKMNHLCVFERVVGFVNEIDVDCGLDFYDILAIFNCDFLDFLLKKYSSFLSELLRSFVFPGFMFVNDVTLKKLAAIFESDVCYDAITYIEKCPRSLIRDLFYLVDLSEKSATEYFCLLLSYGLTLHGFYVDEVFRYFGFCDLFRYLLQMDFSFDKDLCTASALFYNVTLNLENSCRFSSNLGHFLDYRSKRNLQKLCACDDAPRKKALSCKAPDLLELARNAARKYFVMTFEVTSFRELDFVLSKLPIPKFHRKIITLEEKI